MPRERSIMMADCQSYYASIEKAAHPELRDKPVAIGDPARRSGIVLAACPEAKARGVSTAQRVSEAQAQCPDLVIVRPRMMTYIRVSMLKVEIFESVTELVEPYSGDEDHLDVTGSTRFFGTPQAIAKRLQTKMRLSTGVHIRLGISSTKVLAKMATDNFAKDKEQAPTGIFTLPASEIEHWLWPLPISKMFMVAGRMTGHFLRMGIQTIGDLARMDLGEFKERMRLRMGKKQDIQAEYYWQTANGIDPSPVVPDIKGENKVVNSGRALKWAAYKTIEHIEPLMLELIIETCRRARRYGKMGRVVHVGAAESDGVKAYRFGRQKTLWTPSYLEYEIAPVIYELFMENWRGLPLTHLFVTLSDLTDDSVCQLDLFEDREKAIRREKAVDSIKDRYGSAAIMRASSLLPTAQAKDRARQIGGHWA